MQDRPGRQRDLVPTACTLPSSEVRQLIGTPVSTFRTDEAIRPAAGGQILLACLVPFLLIAPGQNVSVGNRIYRITQLLGLETVEAQDLVAGTTYQLAIRDLAPVAIPAQATAAKGRSDLSQISEEHWTEARRRFEVIQPLLTLPLVSKQLLEQRATVAGVHSTTVYRWLRAYRAEGELSCLLSSKPGPGPGRKKLAREVNY
jgi:putative transposase